MKIKNQFIPNAVIDPGFEYHESNRAWQGAPSIAMTDSGRLFVGFMSGGIYEPDPRNHMVLVYSDDKGDTWSEPVLVVESKPENNTRCFEIELWRSPENELWMFWVEVPYKKGLSLPTYEQQINMENDSEYHALEGQSVTYLSVCKNPDADELEFSEPRPLFNAVIRNTPYVTDSGRWLFPTYITSPRDFYQFHYSDDCGKTFHTTEKCFGRAPGRAYDEPSFHKCADGRIAVTVRTTPKMEDPHTYKRMFSSDEGITWSQPEEFMLAASQRPCTGNISDGRVVMIPSISARARNGFKLTISDDGINFRDVMLLDDRERISYAEFVEGEDGTLYIAYDRERNNKLRKSRVTGLSEAAKEILFARIPKAAWESGEVTPDTVRARIITKARINELDNMYTKQIYRSPQLMDRDELLRAHRFSSMHREALSENQRCGCFYCQKIFSSNEIEIWIDEGKTALCPFCCIDSVIGESSGYEITEGFLRSMHLFFFESFTGDNLRTDFGDVILKKDGKKRYFTCEALDAKAPYENVDGTYKIEYQYNSDGKEHTVELILDNPECEGGADCGEDMYAFTSDIGGGRITLSFINKGEDLAIDVKKDRLRVTVPAEAPSQTLTFGVCFMKKLPSSDNVETWLGADVG